MSSLGGQAAPWVAVPGTVGRGPGPGDCPLGAPKWGPLSTHAGAGSRCAGPTWPLGSDRRSPAGPEPVSGSGSGLDQTRLGIRLAENRDTPLLPVALGSVGIPDRKVRGAPRVLTGRRPVKRLHFGNTTDRSAPRAAPPSRWYTVHWALTLLLHAGGCPKKQWFTNKSSELDVGGE